MKVLVACLLFVLVNVCLFFFSDSNGMFVNGAIPIHQHSLEPPLLVAYEESGFPFWTIGKSTVATNDYIRLTPAPGSGHGYLWNKHPAELKQWRTNFTIRAGGKPEGFHVFGNGDTCRTCGSAFWHVSDQSRHGTSTFFGVPNRFRGVGIVFPNDKSQLHIVQSDGQTPVGSLEEVSIASCPFTLDTVPRIVTVTYSGGSLSVSYAPAARPTYVVSCAQNVQLSYVDSRYYFGFTAIQQVVTARGMDIMKMATVGTLNEDADATSKMNLPFDPQEDNNKKMLWDGKPDIPLEEDDKKKEQEKQQQQQPVPQQPQQQQQQQQHVGSEENPK